MIVTRQVMLPLRSGFQGVARCGPVYALIHGMTPDGSVIVGRISDADDQLQAFRWSEATGLVGLGVWQAGGHGLLPAVEAIVHARAGYEAAREAEQE